MKDNLKHRKLDTRNTYIDKKTDMFGMANMEDVRDWIETNYGVKVIFMVVTGSHMWNLSDQNSDLDVRGYYVKPTEQILSLHSGRDTIEANKVMGKEIDIQFYEIEKGLILALNGNGNMIEMIGAPTVFYKDKSINWNTIYKKSLCKNLGNYYKGYAHSQRKRATRNRGGKALLYTYREIMAGTWLMRTGKIVYDFTKLKPVFAKYYGWHSKLLDWAYVNKSTLVTSDVWDKTFMKDWEYLLRIFDDERGRSRLPEKNENYYLFNEILLDIRSKH